MFKRACSLVLAFSLLLSFGGAWAVEDDAAGNAGETCTCETLCAEGAVNAGCPVCGAEGADLTSCAGTKTDTADNSDETDETAGEKSADETDETAGEKSADEKQDTGTDVSEDEDESETAALSEEAQAVRDALDELPTLDEIKQMSTSEQAEIYEKISDAYDAFCELSEEEQDEVCAEGDAFFEPFFDYFNSLTETAEDSDYTVSVTDINSVKGVETATEGEAYEGDAVLLTFTVKLDYNGTKTSNQFSPNADYDGDGEKGVYIQTNLSELFNIVGSTLPSGTDTTAKMKVEIQKDGSIFLYSTGYKSSNSLTAKFIVTYNSSSALLRMKHDLVEDTQSSVSKTLTIGSCSKDITVKRSDYNIDVTIDDSNPPSTLAPGDNVTLTFTMTITYDGEKTKDFYKLYYNNNSYQNGTKFDNSEALKGAYLETNLGDIFTSTTITESKYVSVTPGTWSTKRLTANVYSNKIWVYVSASDSTNKTITKTFTVSGKLTAPTLNEGETSRTVTLKIGNATKAITISDGVSRLQQAINDAEDGVETTIKLEDYDADDGTTDNNIVLEKPLEIPANKKIVLTSDTGMTVSAKDAMAHLVVVKGGELTLDGDVTYDCKNVTAERGAFIASSDTNYESTGGGSIVMKNGKVTGINSNTNYGSAFFLAGSSSSFKMTGGEISGNTFGDGGVYCGPVSVLNGATFDMSGGTISGNTAHGRLSSGGAFINNGTMTMSGGTITGNKNHYTPTTGKYAGQDIGCGGGINVIGTGASLTLTGGRITNNEAGYGGGIMIGVESSTTATLKLTNALITDNTAELTGGGVWFCPTGSAVFYVTDGGAIYDNTAGTESDDLNSVVKTESGASVTLENQMLGGGAANWYVDASGNRYTTGSSEQLTELTGLTGKLTLKDVTVEDAKTLAESQAEIVISDNTAAVVGGGIACNGSATFGDPSAEEKSLTVQKDWKYTENTTKPDAIYVGLYRTMTDSSGETKEYFTGRVLTLNAENGWKGTFDGIPADWDLTTSAVVKEMTKNADGSYSPIDALDGYAAPTISAIAQDASDTTSYNVTITNEKLRSITVTKTWTNDYNRPQPTSVTAALYRNGTQIATAELNAENNWTYTWTGLLYGEGTVTYDYSVGEQTDLDGYKTEITQAGDTFTITNTAQPMEISATKQWNHTYNRQDAASVTVALYDGDTKVETAEPLTLSAANSWTGKWESLPYSTDYTVKEETAPEGFTTADAEKKTIDATHTSFTITNTDEPMTVTATKKWSNEYGRPLPETITLALYDGDTKVEGKTAEVKPDEDGAWTYTWENLPYSASYTVKEENVPDGYEVSETETLDYTAVSATFELTNTDQPMTITVKKEWVLDNGREKTDSVEVTLYNGETKVETVKLSESNSWTYTWEDLDYSTDYTVKEESVPTGFTSSVAKSTTAENTFVITNDDTAATTTTTTNTTGTTGTTASTASSAKTGDETPLGLYLGLLGAAGFGAAAAALALRKKR